MGGESAFSQSRYFWQHGLSLNTAALKFNRPELIAHYDAIAKKPFPEVMSPPPPADFEVSWLAVMGAMATALQPIAQSMSEKNHAFAQLCESIRSLVLQGKLRAYGYELPRRAEDNPKLIPVDVWGSKIDWKESSVSGYGLSFVAVRLLPVHWEAQLIARLGADVLPAQIAKVGRPSVKFYVNEAYEALKVAGRLAHCQNLAQAYDLVRQWLSEKYPADAARLGNLSDETIRKFISARFKADFRRP